MGGTGKTPMVEYLIRLLYDNYKITTLSRGYKRKTYGFRIANENDDAKSIGDEPYQFFQKYGKKSHVTVSEDRVYAIPNILFEFGDNQIVIMDDGFQQRGVIPDLSILLTEYDKPFFKDWVLPTGNLREARRGARRSDVIVVTKCPSQLPPETESSFRQIIDKYAPGKPVYFSSINYLDPKPVLDEYDGAITDNVIIFSGIAHPDALENYVREKYNVLDIVDFGDHHNYDFKDIEMMIEKRNSGEEISLLTTEKDRSKLLSSKYHSHLEGLPIFYLPIEISFLPDGKNFDKVVLDAVKRNEFT